MTSKRVSIPRHHLVYLQSIASQMGVQDTSEVLNYLIWELRRSNYAFGGQLPQQPQPQPNHFDPSTFEQATAMSGLSWQPTCGQAIQDFEEIAEEIDPIIARMATLIENF